MIGQTVGNYRITGRLGQGGMGTVYLAEHPGFGRRAAVKLLRPELTRQPQSVQRFFNEARAANAVGHPGIVDVLDMGTLPDGTPYIVMEHLAGESLAARLRRNGRLPPAEAVDVALQAAAALGAAHGKGIVHRDLKPDNLFLIPDVQQPGHERLKILDFGIAKLEHQAEPGAVHTETGTLMGTPLYMSPEQCRGAREVDHRTDIYALGVILYQMLVGAPPFVSEGQGELIHLHISAPPPPPRARNPELTPELEAVVLQMLAKAPDDRQPNMAVLHHLLMAAIGRRGVAPATEPGREGPTAPPPGHQMPLQTTLAGSASALELGKPTRPRRRPWLLAAGTALVVAVAGAVALQLNRTPEPPAPVEPRAAAPAFVPTPAVTPPPPRMVNVSFTSQPAGARVVRVRDGAVLGTTPLQQEWQAERGAEPVRLEKDGYRTEEVVVPLDRGGHFSFPLSKLGRPRPAPKPRPSRPEPAPPPKPREPTPI